MNKMDLMDVMNGLDLLTPVVVVIAGEDHVIGAATAAGGIVRLYINNEPVAAEDPQVVDPDTQGE